MEDFDIDMEELVEWEKKGKERVRRQYCDVIKSGRWSDMIPIRPSRWLFIYVLISDKKKNQCEKM